MNLASESPDDGVLVLTVNGENILKVGMDSGIIWFLARKF
jgi:hypothetical protein